VVSTLVLCSVEDQKTSLDEIYRLLRPGGTLRLIEHVVADSDPKTLRWQKILNPVWNFMCCNCHLTRDTASAIEQAGFRTDRLERAMIEEAPSVVKYNLRGIAEKR
jgi:ubiquinone/menaquinone biosynthesis C-methylase UbiE